MAARAPDRYCGGVGAPVGVGDSATASAFGARVGVVTQGRSLVFVAGREGSAEEAVHGLGGTVVTHLPGDRLLGVIALEALGALQAHPAVSLAGPVTVDPARFGAFARLVGLDGPDAGDHEARPP